MLWTAAYQQRPESCLGQAGNIYFGILTSLQRLTSFWPLEVLQIYTPEHSLLPKRGSFHYKFHV